MVKKHEWTQYVDFYRESAYSIFPQQHRGAFPGRTSFRMIEVDQADHDFTDPNVPETVLALPLSAASDNRWSWNMGDGWRHEIAQSCGFTGQSHFTRVFKLITGEPPKRWQQLHKR
jgi:AraC family transcriptional regulator